MGLKPRKNPEEERTITRSIRLRLQSPVGASWKETAPDLHALKPLMHRIFQAAVLRDIIAVQYEGYSASSPKARTPLRTQAIKDELAQIAEHTKNERTRDWTENLASSVRDAIQRRAGQEAQNYLKKRFTEPRRIPSAGYPAPIYVRDGQWALEVNGNLALSINLRAGRAPWYRFTCAPIKGAHWRIVRELAAGRGRHRAGDLKLVYSDRKDRKTKKKRGWEAIISVTSPAPKVASGSRTLAVHRGVHNFIYYADTGGGYGALVTGTKLVNFKRKMDARRKAVQSAKREIGSGARGHGKRRRYQASTRIGDKEARFVRTFCQQTAASLVKLAIRRSCGVILLEDYGGIVEDEEIARFLRRAGFSFPLHQLAEAIKWAAAKEGIRVERVPPEYISTTCPRCENADERQHVYDGREGGTFSCRRCGYQRAADLVAVLHLLRRSGADMTVWDARFAAAQKLADATRRRPEDDRKETDDDEEGPRPSP